MKNLLSFLKQKTKRFITYLLSPVRRRGLTNRDFTIISNNCWGGLVYQRFNLPYRTPFVGLFVPAPCFIKLLEDFENNMKKSLSFIPANESLYFHKRIRKVPPYPIAILNQDIEIHFLHAKTEQQAAIDWERRKKRINLNNMLVKFAEMDWCTPDLIIRFDELPFEHKICFTAHDYPTCKSSFRLPRKYIKGEQLTNEFNYVPSKLKTILNNCGKQS